MAKWSGKKVDPNSINRGEEYKEKDRLSIESLNAIVNASLYAQDVVEKVESFDPTALGEFVENEFQKSKNLLALKNFTMTHAGVTITFDEETQIITFNGTCAGANDFIPSYPNLQSFIKNMKGKTITASNTYISGSISGTAWLAPFLCSLNDAYHDRYRIGGLTTDGVGEPKQIVIETDNVYNAIMFYMGAGTTFDNYAIKIQIEEGTTSSEWTYPYGAIVHNKDLKSRELVYNFDEHINIMHSSLTTLREYFDLFSFNDEVCYYVHLGDANSSNFQTLVGSPFGENYISCVIKKYCSGDSDRVYEAYQLFAQSIYGRKASIGYIYKNLDGIKFSGWQGIGG